MTDRFTGEIKEDAYAEAPADDICNIGYLIKSRYCLGDTRCTTDELDAIERSSDAVWLPVYAHVHSGSTIATTPFNDPWDSGQSGLAWITYEDALDNWGEHKFGKKVLTKAGREKAKEYIRGTVETFNQWLTGDVYGFVITDTETGEESDSCWGFFGRQACEEALMEELARLNQDAEFLTGLAAAQSRGML